jgi:hypothetical protein
MLKNVPTFGMPSDSAKHRNKTSNFSLREIKHDDEVEEKVNSSVLTSTKTGNATTTATKEPSSMQMKLKAACNAVFGTSKKK